MTSKARQLSHFLSVVFIGGLSTVVACSSGGGGGDNTGGNPSGGSSTGGKANGGTGGGSTTGGSGGTGGGSTSGGSGGTGGSGTTGGSGPGGTGTTGGSAGGASGCTNTDTSKINLDASGYVCNNTWGIKGAWYCYSDGSDTTTSCKGSDGKGAGAIPWTAASSGMCIKGKMSPGDPRYVGMGFKLNSGPPGGTDTPGTWNANGVVGFAITLAPGSTGAGSGGSVLYLEYQTPTNHTMDTNDDAPGVTLPGVGAAAVTYNVLFSDAVLANSAFTYPVDPTKLTDVTLKFPKDNVEHAYDFCIKSITPLMTAPAPVAATGAYGPVWNNKLPQAVNGINGYAVQTAPFPKDGQPMTMQVNATATGVGFTYKANFTSGSSTPGAYPAIVSGYGPGHDGIQYYGPYKGGKSIGQLQSVKSSWSFSMDGSGDAAYDVWFSNAPKAPYTTPAVELMVWIGNKDKMPIGYGTAAGPAVMGKTPYTGNNGKEPVVSYWVSPPGANSAADIDLLPYFKDAASHGYAGLSNSSVLMGIQAGFEVYSGTWTTTDYKIDIQ